MTPAHAQRPPLAHLPATEVHTLEPPALGHALQLRVARPLAGFNGGNPPHPAGVLYLLDGDLYFGTATETTRLMNQFMGELPPLLVVGVGYGGSPTATARLRTRDYTPSSDPAYVDMLPPVPDDEEIPHAMGGAETFLDVLEEEVQPFVEARYEVKGLPRYLFGSSTAGLLGVWALLTRPGLMDGWILTSPSLWWDEGVALERERTSADDGPELSGQVYLAAGSLEEGIGNPILDGYRLVSNTRLLAERLAGRADPKLRVTTEILDGETHTSVVPSALLRGLRALTRPR